ncbi:pentalenene synthase [Streptomyces sp. SLBN-118]|uniref:isoafricanol synthase n=1 Tax=Streptomyces sp. SLBN-118 TaxID=2768454 RepID=UPI0011696ECF|nr:isoafricanol synthase [Streptomyces sp. SLBN-118]TQK42625.1 pentalenene synthase [Streptomyces sp. SLBN-118]
MANARTFGPNTVPTDPTRRTAAIRIPFPARFNSHAERARRHSLQWLQETGLLMGEAATAEYDALRLERLMAYFYPDATGNDLELAADFNAWFFIFDDQFDGHLGMRPEAIEPVVASLVGTMKADGPPQVSGEQGPPLVQGFEDIWRRATSGTPYNWQRRFRTHWRAYMTAHLGEAHNRNAQRLPSLEQFLRVRRDSIGVQPCLDFTERCGGYTLPDELHDSFPLREMREITGDVVIFVNDIVSLVKELAAGDVNNSVIILREQRRCTLEESVECIAARANTHLARFAQLAAALPKTLSERGVLPEVRGHIEHYVEGMGHLMAGNLAWSLATSRYDETGIAAVSGGRQRPWAHLAVAREPSGRGAGRNVPTGR